MGSSFFEHVEKLVDELQLSLRADKLIGFGYFERLDRDITLVQQPLLEARLGRNADERSHVFRFDQQFHAPRRVFTASALLLFARLALNGIRNGDGLLLRLARLHFPSDVLTERLFGR